MEPRPQALRAPGFFGGRNRLQRAEQECLADADARARRQMRESERRAELDQEYIQRFAAWIRELYPACPAGREQAIAEHACQK